MCENCKRESKELKSIVGTKKKTNKFYDIKSGFMVWRWKITTKAQPTSLNNRQETWVHPRLLVSFVLLDLFIFCEMFCRSLFVLFVLFLSAIVVSFIYVRFMITSLASSNLFGTIGLKSSLSNAIFIYWFHPLCFNEIQVDKRVHWPSNIDDC